MNVKLVLCRGKGLRIQGNIMRDQDFSYFIEKFEKLHLIALFQRKV